MFNSKNLRVFLVLCSVFLSLGWYLVSLTSHTTYFYDEWIFLASRDEFSIHDLAQPHNGHLTIIPAFVFIFVFKIFGFAHHEIFQWLAVMMHLGIVMLSSIIIQRRHGWFVASVVGLVLALLGGGAENFFWGFQISFMGGLFFFLLSLICFNQSEKSEGFIWPLLTLLAVMLSVGSSGTGLGTLAAIFFLTAMTRQWKKFWWVIFIPSVMYFIWYRRYGGTSLPKGELVSIPIFVMRSASNSVASIFGIDQIWGALFVGLISALLLRVLLVKPRRLNSLAFLIFTMFFWAATAYGRGVFADPNASRYLYIGVFGIVLLVSESVHRSKDDKKFEARFIRLLVAIASLLAIFGSHKQMEYWANLHQKVSESAVGQLVVAEAHRDNVDDAFVLQYVGDIPVLYAGEYFQAISKMGSSPVDGRRNLFSAPGQTRLAADDALLYLSVAKIDLAENTTLKCDSVLKNEQSLSVPPGGVVHFQVMASVVVTMSRFYEPISRGTNDRSLDPGIYTATLENDNLGGELKLTLSDSGSVSICQ